MTEAGLYSIEDAKLKMNKLQEEIQYLQYTVNNLKKDIELQSMNHLEVKRDKLVSIQAIIDKTESKIEINRLYKTILKRVAYTRVGNSVNIEVEFL